jgi:hypothetical protein
MLGDAPVRERVRVRVLGDAPVRERVVERCRRPAANAEPVVSPQGPFRPEGATEFLADPQVRVQPLASQHPNWPIPAALDLETVIDSPVLRWRGTEGGTTGLEACRIFRQGNSNSNHPAGPWAVRMN